MSAQSAGATALTFTFSTQSLRVVMIDGEPWFVAADVCEALEHSDTSKAVSRLDNDEKLTRTMFVSGQNREMLIINESGLYSLILTSRKPEAKKFKKWVTSEVLPAIRKTGRYIDPSFAPMATPPRQSSEKLNSSDMQHLKRLVWMAAHSFRMEETANQAIWYYLRQITNNPAPNAYTVDHIPCLATELRRIICIAEQVAQITRKVEAEATRRIFRHGDAAEKMLLKIELEAAKSTKSITDNSFNFPKWMELEMINFQKRDPVPAFFSDVHAAEQPDFFRQIA